MHSTWRGLASIPVETECSQAPNSYVYYTQIMQAETLGTAYRLWRRNWMGPGKEYTAGALVWQVGRTLRILISSSRDLSWGGRSTIAGP